MRIKNKELRQRRHRKEKTIKAAQREERVKWANKGAGASAEKAAPKPKAEPKAKAAPKKTEGAAAKPKKAPAKKKAENAPAE
jgi:hypothetical protein